MNLTRLFALVATVSLVHFAVPTSAPAEVSATTPFTIHWTAPGDDAVTGRATVYELRYSSAPLTAANFSLAPKFTGLPVPAVAGTAESFVVSGLSDTASYYLALKSADEAGNWSAISNIVTRPGQTTDSEQSALTLSFSAPWPNPARQSVRWAFSLPRAERIQVEVFDVTGRHVHTVADGAREPGRGELSWDLRDDQGRRVDAGMYFVKARLGATEWTKRVVVVR